MLINLKKEVEGKKGKLKLSNINPQIYEVFKITRLSKHFDIHEQSSDAINSFS